MIVNDWTEAAIIRGDVLLESMRWDELGREVKAGIEDAKMLIAEATGRSALGVGHEVGLALSLRKPVLTLVEEGALDESYVSSIAHPLLLVCEYRAGDVTGIIKSFIKNKVE